ncbi:hypothetical protein [Chitinophaga qingshengii]|uniref:Uncharacterized protein n=1 Tax=Chitinophaga qingshengii TaxID=1569794 RepID=A0ABR7TTP0_9BACT|nr:hypothetical protein [Chitinophaga qingshengii]MBC9932816.1 hypothetical protein [Chitinophaga qingshengii]
MYRIGLLISMFLLWCASYTFGQLNGKKNRQARNAIFNDVTAIQQGRNLEYAEGMSVREFVLYYLRNKARQDLKYGNIYTELLYKDSLFTYFGKRVPNDGLVKFFKVSTPELEGVNYEPLDTGKLTERFMREIFPAADKKLLGRGKFLSNCWEHSAVFDYQYHPDTKQLEMLFRWTVDCNYRFKKMRKRYVARYYLASEQFVK